MIRCLAVHTHTFRIIGVLALLMTSALAAPRPAQPLGPVTNLPLPRFVHLKSSEVNMRRGPGEDHPILWVYRRKNLPVEVVNEFDLWRKVRDVDGAEGWIQAALLVGEPRYGLVLYPGTKAPKGVTGASSKFRGWPLKRRPEAKAATIAIAQPGALAKIVHCDEAWCEVRAGSKVGWLTREALWGVYPEEDIK